VEGDGAIEEGCGGWRRGGGGSCGGSGEEVRAMEGQKRNNENSTDRASRGDEGSETGLTTISFHFF
jgi:hypothetical protein